MVHVGCGKKDRYFVLDDIPDAPTEREISSRRLVAGL